MQAEEFVAEVLREMLDVLDNAQLIKLRSVLNACIASIMDGSSTCERTNREIIELFIAAKRIEGCTNKTLNYYQNTLIRIFGELETHVTRLTTADLREYLTIYKEKSKCSLRNMDNIRRILSTFFMWLENENYILKSPVRRIHKIRYPKLVKEAFSDETLEALRDNAPCLRDLAIVDLLASTGMRVGELVRLNRDEIDFDKRECIVFGKGNKERVAYFDARAKLHIMNYLATRTDDNPALFVSLNKPHVRLNIPGVEIRLRQLGKRVGKEVVHPHKFRRTVATRAIDKGMPIEQVQQLLGHNQIDTTMLYAQVSQSNVKESHRKYLT